MSHVILPRPHPIWTRGPSKDQKESQLKFRLELQPCHFLKIKEGPEQKVPQL